MYYTGAACKPGHGRPFWARPCPPPRLRHGLDHLVALILEVKANRTSAPLPDLPLSRPYNLQGVNYPDEAKLEQ